MIVEKKSIFNFPYFSTKIDPKKYNKDEIVSTIIDNYNKKPNRNKWDIQSNLHHSYNDENNLLFTKLNYDLLHPLYLSAFYSALENLNLHKNKNKWTLKVVNYTAMSKNQHMNCHRHFPATFSGVHYLKFNKEKDMPLVFKNPFESVFNSVNNNHKDLSKYCDGIYNTNWWSSEISIDISEDDFIIFPSVFLHYVPVSTNTTMRICISTNMFLDTTYQKNFYNYNYN